MTASLAGLPPLLGWLLIAPCDTTACGLRGGSDETLFAFAEEEVEAEVEADAEVEAPPQEHPDFVHPLQPVPVLMMLLLFFGDIDLTVDCWLLYSAHIILEPPP